MSNKDDIKFHSPIPYHKVIEELSDTIFEKFVNDERSNDRFLETPALQDFVKRFEEDSSMYSEEDEMNQMIVRQMGIYLVAQLICQISVFGRPIMFKERWVGNQLLNMPVYPKNNLPFKYKQTTDDGKQVDYSKIHSLSLMKNWYKKKKGQLKEFLTPSK